MTTTKESNYDPFEAFSDVVAGTTRDPYPDFIAKRREHAGVEGRTHAERLPARGH